MRIKRLSWDSDFFGREIGEVFLHSDKDLIFENSKEFDVIYVKQKEPFTIEIIDFEKSFSETKTNFIKNISHLHSISFEGIRDIDDVERSVDFFQELAYESGKQSRFLLDKNFGETYFKKLYDEWVINSLNKKFAEKVFFIESENKAVGFVTLQRVDKNGKIGLIATHPQFQGKGLGRNLLEFVENYCFEKGITSLEIPTQKENLQACGFYSKLSYEIKEEIIIKHFWKK